ncbi:hypothetical protein BGX29_002297 [Mortierella sp. GBA35]|nr:hypothetical protein BGX29_002297 [Mortierella sp. GBA35]
MDSATKDQGNEHHTNMPTTAKCSTTAARGADPRCRSGAAPDDGSHCLDFLENQDSATSHPTNPAVALGPLSNLSVSRCLRGTSRQHHPRSSKILPGLAHLAPAPGRGASASPHPAEAHGTPSCNDPGIPGQRSHLEPRAGAGGGGTEGRINATVEKLQIQEDVQHVFRR